MSEYQYYEFQALDRRLTAEEMSALRAFSSRGRITPTSFVNAYNYGDFKGDPDDWMNRYFDAFLYLANWGTRELKLRLSSTLLDVTAARAYAANDGFGVREHKGYIVLSFTSGDDGDGEWVDGEGELSSILGVRADLARGDRRALYLGWLLGAQAGEMRGTGAEGGGRCGGGAGTATHRSRRRAGEAHRRAGRLRLRDGARIDVVA